MLVCCVDFWISLENRKDECYLKSDEKVWNENKKYAGVWFYFMIWWNETLLGSLSRPQTYANIYIPVHLQWAPYFQVHDTYLHMITRRRCVCVRVGFKNECVHSHFPVWQTACSKWCLKISITKRQGVKN